MTATFSYYPCAQHNVFFKFLFVSALKTFHHLLRLIAVDREPLYQSAAKGDNLLLQSVHPASLFFNIIQYKSKYCKVFNPLLSLQEVRLLCSQTQFPISAAASVPTKQLFAKVSNASSAKMSKV